MDTFLQETIILLIQGKRSGQVYYAYLQIALERLPELHNALQASPTVNLTDYGEILYWNLGEEPPPDVRTHMETHYGVVHSFEETVETRMRQKIEELRLQGQLPPEEA